jgi:RNA polymerase sigma-70 factor (ECF subfamily)
VTIQDESRATRPASSPSRDRQLVLAFLAGDVDAFSVIAREHYAALCAQARRQLGPGGQAEDAVQETFERALKGIRRFGLRGEYRLGPWLGRILANVCSDHRIRAARHLEVAQSAVLHLEQEGDVADGVADPRTIEIVRHALAAIPRAQSRAVVLHEVDGLAYEELAEVENISVENARARVSRAKSALRRSLGAVRGVIVLPVVRLFGRSVPGFSRFGSRARSVSPADQLAPSTGTSSIVEQLASRIAATPLGQSAWALVSAPPRGTLVFSLAATVATVSASTVLLNHPLTPALRPSVPSALSSAVVGTQTPALAPQSAPSLPLPASAFAEQPASQASPPSYGWVNPTSPSSGLQGTGAVAALPAAPCTATDGLEPPGPGFSYGTPLGMSAAVSVGNAPVTVLPMTGPSISFSVPLSVSAFGGGQAGETDSLSASACLSSDGWFTALVTGPGATGAVSVELVGVLEEVIGSPGDLGYIYRGTVTDQGAPDDVLAGSQFVAQLVEVEPANTVQLTVVVLGANDSGTADPGVSSTQQSGTGSVPGSTSPPDAGATSTSSSGATLLPPFAPLSAPVVTRSPS